MNRKISMGAAVAVAGITAAVTVSLTYVYAMDSFNTKVADVNARQAMYTKLSEIDQRARQSYVGDINDTQLMDGICAGYISGLGDLQAKYMSAEKYQAYLAGGTGKSVGVGIKTVKDEDGNMEVIQVMPNSPAEKAGIKKGDTILTMDGKEIVRITYADAFNRLDGSAGSTVRLGVLRTTTEKVENLELSITRAEYTQQSISYTMLNENVGYIRIMAFNDNSVGQFNNAVASLVKDGAKGLIFDVRNNSGGEASAMAQMLDSVLPAGNTVSYQDKTGETTVEYTSKPNEITLPISVIASETTFGVAEIFAADIKEFKKGLLVGQTTAGYGTKDAITPLSDGSAVTLSTAYYLTPSGNVFNRKGIEPDLPSELTADRAALLARNQLATTEDSQLQAAISALMQQGVPVGSAEPTAPSSVAGTDAVPPSSSEQGTDASSAQGASSSEASSGGTSSQTESSSSAAG